jgi:hypothetical protein
MGGIMIIDLILVVACVGATIVYISTTRRNLSRTSKGIQHMPKAFDDLSTAFSDLKTEINTQVISLLDKLTGNQSNDPAIAQLTADAKAVTDSLRAKVASIAPAVPTT